MTTLLVQFLINLHVPVCVRVCEQLRISTAEAARKPTGKVVGIIKRNWRPFCGMLNVSHIKEVSLDYSITTFQSFLPSIHTLYYCHLVRETGKKN